MLPRVLSYDLKLAMCQGCGGGRPADPFLVILTIVKKDEDDTRLDDTNLMDQSSRSIKWLENTCF